MLKAIWLHIFSASAGLILLAVGNCALAVTFFETVDTGSSRATATMLPVGVTLVNGTIGANEDTDLYAVFLSAGGIVKISLGDSSFDDNLLLFNANGNGLGASDDQGGGGDSRITLFLAAGLYYIGAGANNIAAFTDTGVEIFDNDFGDANGVLLQPTLLAIGFIGPDFDGANGEGSYALRIETTPVPEPSLFVIMTIGLIAVGAMRAVAARSTNQCAKPIA
jgi:Bacterial pre-peptidase C-terminal domain